MYININLRTAILAQVFGSIILSTRSDMGKPLDQVLNGTPDGRKSDAFFHLNVEPVQHELDLWTPLVAYKKKLAAQRKAQRSRARERKAQQQDQQQNPPMKSAKAMKDVKGMKGVKAVSAMKSKTSGKAKKAMKAKKAEPEPEP